MLFRSTIERSLGRRARLDPLPAQPGDVRVTCADISKAARLLGWRPQTSFDEGIRRFTAWHREQYAARVEAG